MSLQHIDPNIYTPIVELCSLHGRIEPQNIHWDSKLRDDLGFASLALVSLFGQLEQYFGLDIVQTLKASLLNETQTPFFEHGQLTEWGYRHIRANLPEVPANELHVGQSLGGVTGVCRVGTLYNLIIACTRLQTTP